MFKKILFAAGCFLISDTYAYNSPFGIGINSDDIHDIKSALIESGEINKNQKINGFNAFKLNTAKFTLDGISPDTALVYVNTEGVVEAIVAEYDHSEPENIIRYLNKKYYKTFEEKSFFGSYCVEYKSGNCLIRIQKPIFGNMTLMYGTINWFNAYDVSIGQAEKIREKRRSFYMEDDDNKSYSSFWKGNKRFGKRKYQKKKFKDVDDLDDMFEDSIKSYKKKGIQSYSVSQTYSRNGQVEEWILNDNGKVTHVKKTPEGTKVLRDDASAQLTTKTKYNKMYRSKREHDRNTHELDAILFGDKLVEANL